MIDKNHWYDDPVDHKQIEINTLKARIIELEERNSYLQNRIRILQAERASLAKYNISRREKF